MGGTQSSLTDEEVQQMREATKFTEEDLQILYRKFRSIDKDGSGTLTTDEFLRIPELANNPLLERVINIFDEDQNNEVEFTEFINALGTFHQGSEEDKLKFVFKVYDINGDGYISNGELYKVLKMMVGSNLTDVQLQQIVDKSMLQADKDLDGKISFEEFVNMVGDGANIHEKLTISIPAAKK